MLGVTPRYKPLQIPSPAIIDLKDLIVPPIIGRLTENLAESTTELLKERKRK